MGHLSRDTSGSALWAHRQDAVAFLRKAARADASEAEDAASEALSLVIPQIDALSEVAVQSGTALPIVIGEYMRTAARRELGRLRRARGKFMSLDAPMSVDNEDGSDFSAFVVSRTNRTDMETYCDGQRAARLARRLPQYEAEMLVMMADGLTADDMAKELHVPTGTIRLQRAQLVRLMQASMERGADLPASFATGQFGGVEQLKRASKRAAS